MANRDCFDEVGVVPREVWDSLATRGPTLPGIATPRRESWIKRVFEERFRKPLDGDDEGR